MIDFNRSQTQISSRTTLDSPSKAVTGANISFLKLVGLKVRNNGKYIRIKNKHTF